MINHFKAEFYKLRHSKILITILGVCAAVIMVSFALGDMTFFGAGDGTESVIGFQAKCYLSSEIPTFQTVARSSLAYTAFFWIIGILFATIFFTKEYNTGTIKLSVAYGTKRTILYYTKAITILVVSLITYLIFVATFFVIEIIQSGYIPTASEVINLLGWALACGTVLLALESISIFLCVVIQNTGIVTGICCLYVFSGASVYLMLWGDMETVSIPLKFFVYGNPMYYWMNFSSCRTMGIIEHLPFYFIGCISLLIVGGLIMIRKEIKLISWKIQIYKVIVQLNAILNRKTKKLVTVSLSDRRLEHLVEIINQIVSKDNIYLGEIQKKENELKENISCLSHDLRTPLTSIRGYLQLLSSAPDEKRAEYISALSGKALRLERLIDDFYQISLLEAGQYPFYYEKVELCSLLTEILLDNYSIFSVNGIEPQIEIPNMDIYLNADRKACIRIIQNLIFNAVTSTTNNVVIQLINIADSVQLCIKNPVASIPTEEYSKLLERFYVADVSRSNGTSGQGLYIVKKLLLMMNCTNPIIEIHDHNFMITIDFSPLLIKK